MKIRSVSLVVLVCFAMAGSALVAGSPAKVPPPPPSALLTVVDHQTVQPGQQVQIATDVNGWQSATMFVEADFGSAPFDLNNCVFVEEMNGLGDELDTLIPEKESGTGTTPCRRDGIQRGFVSGRLFGPHFVTVIDGTSTLTSPVVLTITLYLH